MANEPLRISTDEMYTPQVQNYIDIQEGLAKNLAGPVEKQSFIVRLLYSNWFYLMIWGGIGAICGWAILEPFFDDQELINEGGGGTTGIAALLLFPTVAALTGLFLGAAEGIMCRNPARAVTTGIVGIGVGFVGGCLAWIPAIIVILGIGILAAAFVDAPPDGVAPTGMALLFNMMMRSGIWAIMAIPAGLGQGIATREKKVIYNGLIGAVLGGMIGGFLFDPICMIAITDDGQATYSRGIGFMTIGLSVGLFIGLIEGWTKSAWLMMRKGPLAGKQFILFKDTTVLGSSPKAEIYLFKDEAIEPKHAVIYNRGGRFEIEDCNTPDGTYINGVALKGRRFLQAGDQVVLGKTVLEFALKEVGT